jgi:outer membrane protein
MPQDIRRGKTLNLELAIDLALCRNSRIKSAWAAIKIQTAMLGETGAAYFPVLNGSISRLDDQTNYLNPSDSLAPTYVRGMGVYANSVWRIFDFGGRNANRLSAC